MSSDKSLNFAVIGCGMLARSQHIPNIASSTKTTLHTCCDISDLALQECLDVHGAKYITKDYHEVINNPEIDAICLATTPDLRLPIIREVAAAGKPIYCEKPLANTIDEMIAIQKVVKDAGIPFCVGHNRRSSPAMIEAHKIFRAHMESPTPCLWRYDREGEDRPVIPGNGIPGMSVRINDDWYSWKLHAFDAKRGGAGPMIFEMTHFTDLCNWFMAAEPEEVTALDAGIFNSGIIIRYKNGAMATLMMTANGTFGYPKELYEIFGNGAAVVIDHMLEVRTAGISEAPDKIIYPMTKDHHPDIGKQGGLYGWLEKKRAACKEAEESGDSNLTFTAEPDKGHANAIYKFVDEIRGEGPIVCGIDDTVSATRVAFAAIKSAKEKRSVKLDEIS